MKKFLYVIFSLYFSFRFFAENGGTFLFCDMKCLTLGSVLLCLGSCGNGFSTKPVGYNGETC